MWAALWQPLVFRCPVRLVPIAVFRAGHCSPGARVTYTARVTVPTPLVALMSALREGSEPGAEANTTVYKFRQPGS